MVVFVTLAVTLLQSRSKTVEEELFFNRRALEEQVAENTPAVPGDYFDPRNLKETDPASLLKGGGQIFGRPVQLEEQEPMQQEPEQLAQDPQESSQSLEGEPEQSDETLEQSAPAQMSELEQEPEEEEGSFDTLSEPDAKTSELAMHNSQTQSKGGRLRAEVHKLASGQDEIETELHTLESVLLKTAKAKAAAPVLADPVVPKVQEPQLAQSDAIAAGTDHTHAMVKDIGAKATSKHDASAQLHYGQKILIRTHHGHFVASKPAGEVMTLAHKQRAATFTILNYDDPTDKSPVRFGDVVGLQDKSSKYLAGDVDGRLEANDKALARQDAFVLTDPHNHDDVAHVKATQPVALFSVHFGKFMAVDGDEDLMVHGDSDNSNAQFAMLAQ